MGNQLPKNKLLSHSEMLDEVRIRHNQITRELNESRRHRRRDIVNGLLLSLLITSNFILMTEMLILIVLLLTWPNQ